MDSDNILSILATLAGNQQSGAPQGGPPTNVLQSVAPQAQQAPQAPPTPPPPTIGDIAQMASADSPPAPKQRRSLVDIIGHIADGLAAAGGATPMYQATLDAEQKRAFGAQDQQQQIALNNVKLATDKFDLSDKHNTRLGQVARGLQAIKASGGNINQAWPILAQRMQLDPQTIQSVGQALASDPNALDGLIAATTDPKYDQSKYGGTVVYAKNKDGKLVAYQPSLGGDAARSILPDDVEPVDPLKFVDTGGAQVGVGTRSGTPVRILPKTAKPDTVLTTTTSRQNNRDTNQTNLTIAGMPARAKNDSSATGKAGDANVPSLLNDIEKGFNDLSGMNALPGQGGALTQIEGAIGRSGIGQKIGEQMGTPAAQKRLEIMKNVSHLQQAMLKSLPASATRTKFEQEMLARGLPDPSKMTLKTAQTIIQQLRQSYAEAVATLSKPQTQTPVGKSDGWTVVGVK